MKRIVCFTLIITTLFSFIACKQQAENVVTPTPKSTLAPAVSPSPTPLPTPEWWAYAAGPNPHVNEGSISKNELGAYYDLLKGITEDCYYWLMDTDADGTDELFISTQSLLTAYVIDGAVKKAGTFSTNGTTRFLYSKNKEYPGIIFFAVGGGVESFGYMTVTDKTLSYKVMWDFDYSGIRTEKGGEQIKNYSPDEAFITESVNAYKNQQNIPVYALKSLA